MRHPPPERGGAKAAKGMMYDVIEQVLRGCVACSASTRRGDPEASLI